MPTTNNFEFEEDEVEAMEEKPDYVFLERPETAEDDPRDDAFTSIDVVAGRPIFSTHQVLVQNDLYRGVMVLIKDNYAPDLMVVVLDSPVEGWVHVFDISEKKEMRLSLADHSVTSYSPRVWQNCRFMVFTGKNIHESRLSLLLGS